MDIHAERFIPATPQATWDALNNPEVLKGCIPGCDSFERTGDEAYQLQMLAKVGPVSAKFKGQMQMRDVQAPTGYTIQFEGQGGVAGFAKGSARVDLEAHTQEGVAGTMMRYAAQAQIGGKLAQIGSRLVDAAARKMADDFFERFVASFPAPTLAPPPAEAPAATAPGLWARLWRWITGRS